MFRYDKKASIAEMQQSIQSHCDERDLPVTLYRIGTDTLVALYFVHRNSPYLDGSFFLDAWLGVAIVHTIGDWMFVFDSDGAVPDELPGMGEAVPPTKLRRVFQDPTLSRLTHVSVRNSNLASNAVRTRAFSAVSIRETLPSTDDRGSVCSTAEGYTPRDGSKAADSDDLVRRYVGFRSGRVSDYGGDGCRLDEYLAWLAEIETRIRSTSKALPEFVRFAQASPVPPDPTPTHILLDAAEILERYVTIPDSPGSAEEPLTIEDRALPVTRRQKGEGTFQVTANGTRYPVSVRYDASRQRYMLSAPDLESAYRPTTTLHSEGVVRLLNSLQGFRLLTKSRGYFFTHGQFYHPEVEFGPSYNDDQLGVFRVLVPVPELKAIGSEKGDHGLPPHDRWPAQSLFGLVQDLGAKTALATHLGIPTHLVCDDLESESADFILADTARSLVAFIHAKASSDWRPCSASELEVVCGQAMKNVRYLAKFTEQEAPVNCPKWGTKDWKVKKRTVSRVLRGPKGVTGLPLWNEIHRLIRDPHAQCEVWLLLGRMFSVSEFRKRLTAPSPEPEAVQAAYLLLSTMTSAYSVGARLKVFCSP